MTSVYKEIAHDSAARHVTGNASYVDDIPTLEETLHLAFGWSEVPCGVIESVDLGPVKASAGVVGVLLACDLPAANDVSPSASNEPLLAEESVNFVGQPIFMVIATSHRNARKAARLAKVVVDEREPILSIDDALRVGSRFENPLLYESGDPDGAIAAAHRKIEGKIEIGGQEHFYLEGQVALAVPMEGSDMLVYSSSQHPTEIQHKVAESLGIAMNAVRIEVRRMGGGFGGKESQANALACACALAARVTGRPCKMRYDRDDDMILTGKRHDFRIEYEAGFDRDGRIAGVIFRQFARCGWSQDLSLPVADRAMLHADNAYHLPAARISSDRLRTNTQSATAFRGFGGPQGMVGIERVLDHIAHELGRDPAKIRQINLYRDSEKDVLQRTPYGMPVEDSVIREVTQELLENSNYSERRSRIREWNSKHEYLKRGIAYTPVKFGISFTLTHLNQAGALVHVYQDGSIHLNHGGTEMGQGLFVKVAQVAANAFDQPIDSVKITATDTGKVPNTSATAASSGSDINGMAVKCACDKIVGRISASLASLHQVEPEFVRLEQGEFHVGSETYTFKEAVNLAYMNRVSLSATGFYATPKINWDRRLGRGRPFFYFAYGAAVSEIVIDTLTGENRILRADLLHDAGSSLNPAIDIGQIEGGYVQCAGWLTTEELVWDRNGRLMTHAPSTYKIPTCSDRPDAFNVSLWGKGRNRQETIYRSKAVGEPPFMLGISVLMALSDAVSACGEYKRYPALDAPATPERILAAVNRIKISSHEH